METTALETTLMNLLKAKKRAMTTLETLMMAFKKLVNKMISRLRSTKSKNLL